MNKYLLLIFLVSLQLGFSQDVDITSEENYIESPSYYYDFLGSKIYKGNVRELIIDVNRSFTVKEKLVFNTNGKLLEAYEYEKSSDTTLFLKERNIYNKNGQLINKIQFDKKFGRLGNGYMGYLDGVHVQETKKNYSNNGDHLSTYFKSSFQDEFFLTLRNTYNSEGLLIKEESFNNHVADTYNFNRTCHGDGYFLKDFIMVYKYNTENKLISKIRYVDTSIRHIKSEDTKNRISIIKTNDVDYFNEFLLEREYLYRYNDSGKLIEEKIIEYNLNREKLSSSKIIYKYNNNLLTEIINNNQFNTHIKKYSYIKRDSGFVKDGVSEIYYYDDAIKRLTTSKILYNPDGSFIKQMDNGNITHVFNANNDLVRILDDKGEVVKEIVYMYDDSGNWTEKSFFNTFGVEEKIIRKFKYY